MTDDEIAKAAGLSRDRIFLLSHMVTWDGVDLPTMKSYLRGCGIDFCNRWQMHKIKVYLKITTHTQFQPAWRHLRGATEWKTLYEPLLKRYQRSINEIIAQ